ncbi:DUF5313 family protein [Trujillonella endophytica]|uniref:DUF5313 domain-containing protein n=1 Tax=Trujillonella endophytica TaxID=673521 RepID=A0A1H8PYC2_9ACTN|nr:DUF5313 family protein [Trujillella endophytica]SEO46945.1 hypothetical protein SAMN05660991_00458 [Trujillella endophytica]
MTRPVVETPVLTEPLVRPNPLRWVLYAFGAGLPARHRSWVLHDVTTRTWGLRHVARTLVQLSVPIALVVVLVPGPLWLRCMTALIGLILGTFFAVAYMSETVENRVRKAGYPIGSAQAGRDRISAGREALASQRRRAAAARRAERYRARQGR